MANDGMMSYFAKIGLDSSQFLNGLSKADAGVLAFYRDITVSMQMTMMIFDRVISYGQKFGEMANDLRDLSYTTGITTQKLQQMQYAAVLSGTPFYTVSSSINRLTLSMEEAMGGTESYVDAFNQLGVNPTGKSPDQVFEETTAALMRMEDPTKRNAVANTIYGKSWKEMLPYMETYIEKRDEIAKAPTISDKDHQTLNDSKVAWDKMTSALNTYQATAVSTIANIQNELNKYNLVAKFLFPEGAATGASVATPSAPDTPLTANPEGAGGSSAVSAIDAVTAAMKEYRSAIEEVADEQERLNDINKDYLREMSILNPRDVSSARNLMIRHKWAVEDQMGEISSAQGRFGGAAANMARAAGDLIINIDGKRLLSVPGVVAPGSGERWNLMQKGIS